MRKMTAPQTVNSVHYKCYVQFIKSTGNTKNEIMRQHIFCNNPLTLHTTENQLLASLPLVRREMSKIIWQVMG